MNNNFYAAYRFQCEQELEEKKREAVKIIKLMGNYTLLSVTAIAYIAAQTDHEKHGYKNEFLVKKALLLNSLEEVAKINSVNVDTSIIEELKAWQLEDFPSLEEFGAWSGNMFEKLEHITKR